MRTLFGAGSGIIAFVICGAAACGGGDDSALAPPSHVDAAVDTGLDPTGKPIDASTSDVTVKDAAADAGHDSGPPGSATVTVYSGTAPMSGAKVVFYDQLGAPRPVITTAADGRATMIISSGWSATASGSVMNGKRNNYLTTFIDLEPGDDVPAYVAPPFASPGTDTMTVDAPSGAVTTGDTASYFRNGCVTNFGNGSAMKTYALCESSGDVNVFVSGTNGLAQILDFAARNEIAFSNGVEVSGLVWQPATQAPVNFSGAFPASAIGFSAQNTFFANGLSYGTSYEGFVLGDGGMPTVALGTPVGSFITDTLIASTIVFPGPDTNSPYTKQTTQAAISGSYAVDLAALPPEAHDGNLDVDDTGLTGFDFTADGSISDMHGMIITVYSLPGLGATEVTNWTIIAPPETSVTIPLLTSDLLDYTPTEDQTTFTGLKIQKSAVFGSYAGYKQKAAAYQTTGFAAPTSFDMTETGISVAE